MNITTLYTPAELKLLSQSLNIYNTILQFPSEQFEFLFSFKTISNLYSINEYKI